MTDKQIKNRISLAFDELVPETTFSEIANKIDSASGHERTVINMTEKKKNRKYYIAAVAACILLITGISGGILYNNNFKVESVIGIDVNPAIELSANKHNKVIDVQAINNDGIEILDSMNLESTDLNVAVNAVIGSMVQKGYMADNNSILVTVCNDDETKAANLKEEICSDIDVALKNNNTDAVVIRQTATQTDDAVKFAHDNAISIGKATFILNLAAKNNSINAKELAKMSISEIAVFVQENNIDISDIADYEHDDSIWENIADSIEDVNENAYQHEVYSDSDILNHNEALNHAINHACKDFSDMTTHDVEHILIETDTDDGRIITEVEFVWHGVAFEYEIDAKTGAVLSCEKEQVDLNSQSEELDINHHSEDNYDTHNDDKHYEDRHH